MKFINDINLDNPDDRKGKDVQDISGTLELSMGVLLDQLGTTITNYNPGGTAVNGDQDVWWTSGQFANHEKISLNRQNLLDSFDVHAKLAFEQFNTYRNTLASINLNATQGLPFPVPFKLMAYTTSKSATKSAARTNSANHKIIYGPIEKTIIIGPLGRTSTRTYTAYETYITNSNGTLIYYRWLKTESDGAITSSTSGVTAPLVPNDVLVGSDITVSVSSVIAGFWETNKELTLHVDTDGDENLDNTEAWLLGTVKSISIPPNPNDSATVTMTVSSKSTSSTSTTNWTVGYSGVTYRDYCYK
jgi:hypothetical protein